MNSFSLSHWKRHCGLLAGGLLAILLLAIIVLPSPNVVSMNLIGAFDLAEKFIAGFDRYHPLFVPIYGVVFVALTGGFLLGVAPRVSSRSTLAADVLFCLFLFAEFFVLHPLLFGSLMSTDAGARLRDDGLSVLAIFLSIPITLLSFPLLGWIYDRAKTGAHFRLVVFSVIAFVFAIFAIVFYNYSGKMH